MGEEDYARLQVSLEPTKLQENTPHIVINPSSGVVWKIIRGKVIALKEWSLRRRMLPIMLTLLTGRVER